LLNSVYDLNLSEEKEHTEGGEHAEGGGEEHAEGGGEEHAENEDNS
jgi:hypothetical protein